MKEMTSEVYAEFIVVGIDLAPEDVTCKTGIQPIKIWFKDELISSRSKMRHKQNGWGLRSPLETSTDETSPDVGEHFRVILDQLKQGWQPLVEICSIYQAEFCGVIYTSGNRPAIHFDRAILDAVSQLNAEIGIDLYVLR